jgi:hypothetical protein
MQLLAVRLLRASTCVRLLSAPTRQVQLFPATCTTTSCYYTTCSTTLTTSSVTSRRPLVEPHCVHLPATTKFDYFKQDE